MPEQERPSRRLSQSLNPHRGVTLKEVAVFLGIITAIISIATASELRWWAWRSENARLAVVVYDIRLDMLERRREEAKIEHETLVNADADRSAILRKRRELARLDRIIEETKSAKDKAKEVLE